MAKIIAIVNQKGGVGKTTSCVNLTAALHKRGARTLLCDFDPQANATSGMGVDKGRAPNVYDLLVRSVDPKTLWYQPLTAMCSLPTRIWPARVWN